MNPNAPHNLGRQAILVVVGDSINFVAGVLTTVILARIIPVDVMGAYKQLMYLAPLAVSIAEFGISNTIYRYWNALEGGERPIYIKMILMLAGVCGLAASGVLAVFAAPLSHWYDNPLLRSTLLLSSLFPLATIPLMILRPVLICRGNPFRATLLELFFSILSVLALIVPLLMGLSFFRSIAIWILVLLMRLFTIPMILWRDLSIPSKYWDQSIFQKIWQYEFPIQVSRIPGYVMENFDKVVMSLLLTTREFAIYSMGAQELPFIGSIGASISNVLIPNLVEDVKAERFEQINRRWRLSCERTAMLTYPIAVFCIWFSVPVMQLIFSAQYTESSVPFRIFAALTFLRVIEYASLAKAFGRGDIIMKSSFISAGTLVLVSIPLTYWLHSLGMAISFLISTVAAILYYLTYYRRWLNVPLASFFPWPKLLLLAALSMASVLSISLLFGPLLSLGSDLSFFSLSWKLGVLFAGSGIVYAVLLFLFKLFDVRWLFSTLIRPVRA